MTSRLDSARESIEFVELGEHSFSPDDLPGFFAGWSIAAAGNLDMCQGVIDRLNEMLEAGEGRDGFAIGKLVGWAAYHRELINKLAEED